MPEQQNIEYKQSWHDDYLKWICGFANANGGIMYIGINDTGKAIGVPDYKKLLDDIPNKVRNTMGITVEVNLNEKEGRYFIEITTKPYTVPISIRGRYYYRSGSTKQELTGPSLNEFLLKKSGRTWDEVTEEKATYNDIDHETVKIFLHASANAGRLPENNQELDIPDLFEKLRIAENGQLKRAAIILFGKDPGKFYTNTFVKIGRFGKDDADIIFQEVEEGNLIVQLQAVLNQLNRKFLTRQIEFEGMHRIEKGEYPLAAIREMLLNALIHRNYMGAPVQIRVYDEKISIWNEGTLPVGLTLDALKRSHASKPRNPVIADVAFKGGYIDAWGRGTIKILEACKSAGLPEPEMQEIDGGFNVVLFKNTLTETQLIRLGLNQRQVKAVMYVKEKGRITNKEYQQLNDCSRNTASNDLANLVKKNIFKPSDAKGAGAFYQLK